MVSHSSLLDCKIVESKSDWKKFIEFPWQIYDRKSNWAPPLRIAVKDLLDPKKNPFFKHAEMYPLLVRRDGRVVGRALGVIDQVHNSFHSEKAAFFGFFESEKDPAIAQELVKAIGAWAKDKGMNVLRGPINLSTNNECGLLVEGFDDPPTVMMTYNPPYYADLMEQCGLAKAKDLFAYDLKVGDKFSPAVYRQAERLKAKAGVRFRSINMKNFERDASMIREIYNDAWEKNWGFVPMNDEEFAHMAKDLKMIVDPELALIAEVDGKAVGFSVTLPDVNQALRKIPKGKLLPLGLPKLLWHLKGPLRRKTINRCRIVILGVKKAYQDFGLGPLFYVETYDRAERGRYVGGEASWVLEDNIPMNKALERMCGKRTKVYRIYEKTL